MTSHFGAQIFRVALKHDPMGYAYEPAWSLPITE